MTAALAAVGLLGCSSGAETLPPACSEGADAFQRALVAAPSPVRVDGTPISRCFVRRDTPGEIESLGATLIGVAERLSASARSDPRAAVELGYLIGASERGAGRTDGIHSELLRRLEQEAVDAHTPPYRRGQAAGRRYG